MSRRSRSRGPATLLVACAIAATSVSGCGSGEAQCLDNADGYIPAEIDGKELVTQDKLNEQLRSELERDEVKSIASGYVKADAATATTAPGETPLTRPDGTVVPPDDPTQLLPEVFVMAAVGNVGNTKSQMESLGQSPDGSSRTLTIDGVDVTVREFKGQNELDTGLAIGQPCEEAVLIAFAFTGGATAAESAMRQMLDSSR